MASTGFSLVRMRAPIIRPLTGVAIIMCYLASISLASAIGVGRWVQTWQEQANLKMSLYIPPIENDATAFPRTQKINQVLQLLQKEESIEAASLVSKQEMAELLAPWIGKQIDLTHMPVMGLVDITLKAGVEIDEGALRKKITQILPDADLENHQQWRIAIGNWVLFAQILAGLVLLAAFTCMAAVISLAAHAAIDANRTIVSIFHLIGAEDNFVVQVFRRHFIRLGLVAGLVGAGAAILTFLAAKQLAQFIPESLSLSAIGLSLETMDYFILGLIPLLSCLVAITASRKQALGHLGKLP